MNGNDHPVWIAGRNIESLLLGPAMNEEVHKLVDTVLEVLVPCDVLDGGEDPIVSSSVGGVDDQNFLS